jgi:hypothetical protein
MCIGYYWPVDYATIRKTRGERWRTQTVTLVRQAEGFSGGAQTTLCAIVLVNIPPSYQGSFRMQYLPESDYYTLTEDFCSFLQSLEIKVFCNKPRQFNFHFIIQALCDSVQRLQYIM